MPTTNVCVSVCVIQWNCSLANAKRCNLFISIYSYSKNVLTQTILYRTQQPTLHRTLSNKMTVWYEPKGVEKLTTIFIRFVYDHFGEFICLFSFCIHSDPALRPSTSVSLVVSVPLSSAVNLPPHTSTAPISVHHQIGNIKSFPSSEQQHAVRVIHISSNSLLSF